MKHILIPARNASTWTGPGGNNTYLLPGRVPTLIDAGVGKPEHVDDIARPAARVRRFGSGDEPVLDNEAIEAGDGVLTAIHTPGHSPDHCCFSAGADIFCGDLARAGGTIVIPAGRGGDLTEYLASLDRVRSLRPERLLPGHGPIIDNPDAIIDGYVRHRAQRDHQILSVLNSGPSIPEEIAAKVYGALAPELTRAAAETVLAHLIKLAREGRAAERDGRWVNVQAG